MVAAWAVAAVRNVAAGKADAIACIVAEVEDDRSTAVRGTVRKCWEVWETVASGDMRAGSLVAGGEGAGHCTQLPFVSCSCRPPGEELPLPDLCRGF
jgi:hypothetical protein